MKNFIYLLLVILSGCSLFPKKVEYFQDKVEKAPEKTDSHLEVQKEAAYYLAEKTDETFVAAVKENVSTNVLNPAVDSKIIANSLSDSLGKPKNKFNGPSVQLSDKLDGYEAKFDSKVKDFNEDNDKNAGKKIEGTGLIQMGYFTQFIILFVIFGVIWIAVKILGILNPAVGIGTKIVSGGFLGITRLAGKGFTELIEAGEKFKEKIENKIEDPKTKEEILELFKQAHKEKQSRDVQDAVKKLIS